MPDPIGANTYKGLGVPLAGESVIDQDNSSNTILTLVHTSANTGNFIQGMDFRADKASSVLTDLVVWDVDVDGGFRVLSGTTVLFELNSSGLYDGTVRVLADGGGSFVTPVTLGTTASTLVSSNAGKMHIVSTGRSSNFVRLPSSGSAVVGEWWEIISNTSIASQVNIVVTGSTGGATIFAHTGSTNILLSTLAIENGTSGVFWAKVVTLSTAPLYALSNMMAQNDGLTTSFYYTLAIGTTA